MIGGDLISLNGVKTGRYEFDTLSGSTYTLDLDKRTMRRQRTDDDPYHALRRDGDEVRLLTVVRCEVGYPALLLIDLAAEGVLYTRRGTTDVLEIRRATKVTGDH